MRRIVNRTGLDSDDDVEGKTETPEPAAEWTPGQEENNDNTMTTVNMQITFLEVKDYDIQYFLEDLAMY